MIFDTLLPHARFLMENGQAGERCFLMEHCSFGIEQFKELFERNIEQRKPKTTLNLPALLSGRIINTVPGRFQCTTSGNVSLYSFQKKTKGGLPEKWFPWLSLEDSAMTLDEFLSLMQSFNEASPDSIYQLFTSEGPLFTFRLESAKSADRLSSLESMIAKSVYQPVSCKSPTLAVHSLLAFNAVNENAGVFGETKDPALIPRELFKFALMFWMLNQMGSLKITKEKFEGSFQVKAETMASGNIGDISNLPLLLDAGNFLLGVHTDQTDASHPIIDKFLSLIREDASDRISLTQKAFTAPATGKAPTNAFRDEKNRSSLSPETRLGFDRTVVNPLLPAYSTLILDRSFSISRTSLTYYVFPEDVSVLSGYLEFLADMVSQIRGYKQEYFKWLEKGSSSKKAKEEKESALARIQKLRKNLWERNWSKFRLSNLLFAFEENVGSSNQKQFAWTSVYHNLPAAKAFLFLEMVDDPEEFGRLATLLHHTSRDLSDGWKEKEVKDLFSRYFVSGRMDQIDFWMRWRKYLTRSNLSAASIEASLWEDAMSVIIQMKAMSTLTVEEDCTGRQLLTQLGNRRKSMDEENRSKIHEYLMDFFLTGKIERAPDKMEKGKESVARFIEQQARNYMAFVDTDSDGWQTIIDGLVCGWALKQICLRIRKDDYKAVIGGKSLAKHTPAQLRTLTIDLFSKAERAGATPWNVQAPLERMFTWSQKNPHTPEVMLFMDAVSLGFMRYDNREEAATEYKGSAQ